MSQVEERDDANVRARQEFQLLDLNAPRLSGTAAWLAANLLESDLLGAPLRRLIFNNSGFTAFRDRAAKAAETDAHVLPRDLPIHYPLPPPAPPAQLAEIDALFHALAPTASDFRQGRPSIRTYYEAYRNGRTTPTQVATTLLRLIDQSNQPAIALNAVAYTKEADVLAQAEASSRRWADGEPLSVLDGVPYTVKVSIDVAGYPTNCSSSFLVDGGDAIVDTDADVVRALRAAGMVMVGKCIMDEMGIGVRGFSMFAGQTRNPHNRGHVPGGSSGGCASAVAAGLCPVSLGSDSAGSIRIPSACCGVFGLKPTFARISTHGKVLSKRDEQLDEVSPLLHNGPITSCAEDLAIMYHLLAGSAPHRVIPIEPDFSPPYEAVAKSFAPSVEGLRIGICLPWVQSGTGHGYSTMKDALSRFFQNGAVEVPVVIPDLEDMRVSNAVSVIKLALKALTEQGYYGEGSAFTLGNDTRMKLKMGAQFSDDDRARSKIVRTKGMEYCVTDLFASNDLDVLVTPALGIDTPRIPTNLASGLIDANTDSKMMKFAIYGNYVGIPACVIPLDKDSGTGLPRAIQLMAAPWKEGKLLELCLWAEKEFNTREVMVPEHCFNPLEAMKRDV